MVEENGAFTLGSGSFDCNCDLPSCPLSSRWSFARKKIHRPRVQMKSSTTTIKEQGRQSHRSYLHPGTYYSIFNDLGFFASSSIILFIITGMRLHPTVLMWITLVSTWIAISSMWIAYVVPFSTVSTQATKNKIYVTQTILIIYWVALVGGPYLSYPTARIAKD